MVNPSVKVCLTSPYLYPSVIGGAERYVYHLAHGLEKLGLEVVVIASKPKQESSEKSLSGVRTVLVNPTFHIGANPVPSTILEKIKQEKPDIVHTQAPTVFADLSVFSCRMLRIPAIATYHAEITQSSVPQAWLKLYNFMHHNLTLRNCDHVIVTTERYRTIMKKNLSESKICVIPVGIEKEFTEAKVPRKAKEELEISIHRLEFNPSSIALFVGVLDAHHMYKGVINLLEAFKLVLKEHQDCLLIIVGDGNKRSLYEMICRKLGLERNTLFMGFVPKELLLAIYSISNILVLPSTSISEGFGTVLLEALSRGCPVITTAYAGGSEVIQQENAGLVLDSPDPLSISRAISTLLEDRNFAKQCAENGMRSTKQKYTWDALSPRVLEIYKHYTDN